jgi:3-isopropylmalate dehydratase small subunit
MGGQINYATTDKEWVILKDEVSKMSTLEVDLKNESITYKGSGTRGKVSFYINEFDKKFLLDGKDFIDITLDYISEIEGFELG